MLRRVGLAHRQHLEHLGVLSGCSEIRTPHRASCPLICVRWTTTSAVERKHQYGYCPSIVRSKPEMPLRARQKTVKPLSPGKYTPPKQARQPDLPLEILTIVTSLLSRVTDERAVLEEVQASAFLSNHLLNEETVRKLAEALACSNSPLNSLRVLSLAHALGCSLRANAYECVCFHLAKKRLWCGIHSAVLLGIHHIGRPTSRLLNWRARALAEVKEYAMLQGVLKEFKEHNFTPTRRTFHLVLSGHIRNRDLTKAKQCFLAMTEAGVPPDASTHAIVATHYRALGADPHVEFQSLEALAGIRSRTATSVVNSLMKLRLDTHDLVGTLRLLTLFNLRDVDAIFAATAQDGNPIDYHSLHGSMPSSSTRQNLIPNAATFAIFINYLATKSDLPGTLQILDGVKAARISPTPALLTSVIHVLFSVGRGNTAVHLVAKLCDPDLVPFSMFEPLLSARTKETFPWAPSGLSPTIQVLNALLRGVLRTQGLKGMDAVLRVMHANNIKPNAVTLELLMRHVRQVEGSNPGVLIRVLRRFSSPDIHPTLRHLHIILGCVLRHEKYLLYGSGWNTTAAKFSPTRQILQREYPEHRISEVVDPFDPVAGIELPEALEHRSLIRSILESLSSQKTKNDRPMLALRIRHDALIERDTDMAKRTFHKLLDRGMRPNKYHFSALMEGLAQSGDLEGALGVMQSAEQAGVKPNVVMFTILIVGYARQGDPDEALNLFQQMVLSGIRPDVPSIDAVSGAFFAVGAYVMAKRVLLSLWPHIEPFPQELVSASLKDLARAFRSLHRTHRAGGKGPTKQERLRLHLELRSLRDVWHSGLSKKAPASRSKIGSFDL